MTRVSMKEAKNRLTEIARLAENGEEVVITRNGKPVVELVAYRPKGGIRWEAIAEFKKKHGIDRIVDYIADDFDEPLPEDFLLRPLPE